MAGETGQAQLDAISGELIRGTQAAMASGLSEREIEAMRVMHDERMRQLQTVDNLVGGAVQVATSARDIFTAAERCYLATLEFRLTVERFRMDAQRSKDKLDKVAPMYERQLDRLSTMAERALDDALKIDPSKCSATELQHRTEILRTARALTDNITNMMMQLVSI